MNSIKKVEKELKEALLNHEDSDFTEYEAAEIAKRLAPLWEEARRTNPKYKLLTSHWYAGEIIHSIKHPA